MPISLIAELEDALGNGSKDKRADTLRRVTDTFLSGGEINSEIQRARQEAIASPDFAKAQLLVHSIKERGELNEAALLEFANAQRYEETVAALAKLSTASIETIVALMTSDRNDSLFIPCKAAGLKWSTVCVIMEVRFPRKSVSDHELAQARTDYFTLSQASAQRTLRFWKVREGIDVDGRRSGEDRRSGADTRSVEEQKLTGDRRSNVERRSGLDRRLGAADDVSLMTGDRRKL